MHRLISKFITNALAYILFPFIRFPIWSRITAFIIIPILGSFVFSRYGYSGTIFEFAIYIIWISTIALFIHGIPAYLGIKLLDRSKPAIPVDRYYVYIYYITGGMLSTTFLLITSNLGVIETVSVSFHTIAVILGSFVGIIIIMGLIGAFLDIFIVMDQSDEPIFIFTWLLVGVSVIVLIFQLNFGGVRYVPLESAQYIWAFAGNLPDLFINLPFWMTVGLSAYTFISVLLLPVLILLSMFTHPHYNRNQLSRVVASFLEIATVIPFITFFWIYSNDTPIELINSLSFMPKPIIENWVLSLVWMPLLIIHLLSTAWLHFGSNRS